MDVVAWISIGNIVVLACAVAYGIFGLRRIDRPPD